MIFTNNIVSGRSISGPSVIFTVMKSVKGVEQGLRGDTVTVRITEPEVISDGEGVYIGSSIALLFKVPGDPEEVQFMEL